MNMRQGLGCLWVVLTLALGCSTGTPIVSSDASVSDIANDSVVVCTAPQSVCGGHCTNVQTDPANCGACNMACGTGMVCSASVCQPGCPSPQTVCNGQCVNFTTDPGNCGGCGHACPTGQLCSAGGCATSCAAPLVLCNAPTDGGDGGELGASPYCADLTSDRSNCGGCGVTCSMGSVCMGGACQVSCPMMQTVCAGACRDLSSDSANCGACGTACAVGNNCVGGVCTVACSAGLSTCGSSCANLQTDNTNCGACGVTCVAGQVCSGGACGTTCAMPLITCGSGTTAYCANTTIDPSNCGACGATCNLAHVMTDGCATGACTVIVCASGFADCDGVATNGCETNTQSSMANCGACGLACALSNAVAACATGGCGITSCDTGFADCDHLPADGCEVNTRTDNANCGGCGTVCPSGQVCSGGVCGTTCSSPLVTCGSGSSTFCTNTGNDPANCGGCGTACALTNTAADGCAGGACTITRCATGFGDCDGVAGNGCEVNTSSSLTNCGVCGHACTLANATSACTAGACAIAACGTGFADCDHSAADGCEVNTQTDNANCGGCGLTCGAGTVCASGVCTVTCGTGLTNCTGTCVNEQTDNANCGGCGHVCGAGTSCAAGVCTVTCSTGLVNCTGTCVNEQTDNANCGACGNACAAGTMCSAGSCSTTCGARLTNCSSSCVDLTSSTTNCGTCGHACATGQVCFTSACTLLCSTGQTNCGTACATLATDVNNCGACGHACAAGQTCTGGNCAGSSCLTLHTATPSLPSGIYTIDPDGAGPLPSISVYCDMVTNGGGWTLVQRTVIDWGMTSMLLTNYASLRNITQGSAAPGGFYRLAAVNWPAIQSTNDHLTVQTPIRTDLTSCLPMYYKATGGVWSFPPTGPASLGGSITQNVTIFNTTVMSTTDTGPSTICPNTYNAVPWTYTDCCTTCPSFLGGYWDSVAGAEHPMSSYLATSPDLNGNVLSNVCAGNTSAPQLSDGYYGEASMEYYLR